MPEITVDGYSSFEATEGTRLILALREHDVDILHRCGGFARCTTCRVEFLEGEPEKMTEAERTKLEEKGLLGQVRLSCQIPCDHAMSVRPVLTLAGSDLSDRGPQPEQEITPPPVWIDAPLTTDNV